MQKISIQTSNKCNSNTKQSPGQQQSSFKQLAHSNAGLVFHFHISSIFLYFVTFANGQCPSPNFPYNISYTYMFQYFFIFLVGTAHLYEIFCFLFWKCHWKNTKHLITCSIFIVKSRNFLCKLTQSIKKIFKFFEFEEEKNLPTASKAPLSQC